MDIAIILGVVGGIMHIVAFGIYHRQTLRGASHPNPATWSLWAVLSTLNALSYLSMTGDWKKAILPIMSTLALLVVLTLAIYRGTLSRFTWVEWAALAGGLTGAIAWRLSSATSAHLILQGCIFISFVPTYRDAWRGSEKKALPWLIWSIAYILAIVVVLLRWQGHYTDLVYPVHLLALHFGIGVLALRQP